MKRHLVFLALLSILSISAHSQNRRRDGNWWIDNGETVKLAYVTGFFDGMQLGNHFTYWGLDPSKKEENTCRVDAIDSYKTLADKFFGQVTSDQLVEGLNKFYTDFRNRSITIHNAVWLVVNQIAGTPQKKIDEMIERFRQSATLD